MRSRLGRRLCAVVAALAVGACSRGADGQQAGAPAEEPPPVYVAVGASESVGVGADDPRRQAWPEVFRREALPPRTVFVNLGIEGVNTAEALAQELPRALELEPDLVTIWLNVNDIIDQVAPERYEEQLGQLVHQLRRGGEPTVLVANTPEIDQLPVVARFGPFIASMADQRVEAYNEVTARVVTREGAVLVDLHAASERAEREGRFASLVAADGFHPSTAGHAEVGRLFSETFRASGGLR
ncbi:MAG: SGNH/GDSL hydrolase family protein [Actinobacteria bacterium]|nr:SGNH/GDSL hydrolase family protein [Actinomycetota bacterium]